MNYLLYILGSSALLRVMYEDIKFQLIHLLWFVVWFICACFSIHSNIHLLGVKASFILLAINLIVVLILYLSMWLIYNLKNGGAALSFPNAFNLGDLLAIVIIAIAYDLNIFLSLTILTAITSVAMGYLFKLKKIPFAGIAAGLCLIFNSILFWN